MIRIFNQSLFFSIEKFINICYEFLDILNWKRIYSKTLLNKPTARAIKVEEKDEEKEKEEEEEENIFVIV